MLILTVTFRKWCQNEIIKVIETLCDMARDIFCHHTLDPFGKMEYLFKIFPDNFYFISMSILHIIKIFCKMYSQQIFINYMMLLY